MKLQRENVFTEKGKSTEIDTYSVAELKRQLEFIISNLESNNKSSENIPVFIEFDNKKYQFSTVSECFGKNNEVRFYFSSYDEVQYIAPDKHPENGGEYWESRGCGIGSKGKPDCSGFVKSKVAGERLQRMVRLVLEKDDTVSYLDYREYEPNWIQYKFSSLEFDVEKLDEMSRENNDVLTLDILYACKNEENED